MKQSFTNVLRVLSCISILVSSFIFTFYRGLAWRGFDPGAVVGATAYSFDWEAFLFYFILPVLIILFTVPRSKIKSAETGTSVSETNVAGQKRPTRHNVLAIISLTLLGALCGYIGSWLFLLSAFVRG